MKQFTLLTACFLIFFQAQAQQQFKWVTGGGTNEDLSSDPVYQWEQTEYMCTDGSGNIYALSLVGNDPIYADTFVRISGAYGEDQNILLTSYNCNGQMRWAKLIASSEPGQCTPAGIIADSFGHVYVSGFLTNAPLYIGYDTIISGLANENSGLIQFDTLGHFNWINYIGDNTPSTYYKAGAGLLALDGSNNVHLLATIEGGVHITPTETSIYGTYDLIYNSLGTLLSAVRLDLDSEWYLNGAVIDPVTNKLYVSGQINQSIFGGFLTDTFYAAAFDNSRNLLWQYFCGHGDDDGIKGVTLDQSKHLHFVGTAQSLSVSLPATFSFNGDSVINTHYSIYNMAVILTTDTNGHPEWIKHFDGSTGINGLISITQLPDNKVAAAGGFAGEVTDGTTSLITRAGYGSGPYIAVVDSEGNLLTLQQAYCDGSNSGANVITSDNVGNLYFGGDVADSIFGGTIPAYHTVGGNTDFFVMKYGVDCSCTSGPTASFTDTGTHHTVGVTYTGTTSGIDSVVWSFGDGSTTTGTSATHTYTDTGTYNVCVTVYTDCGVDERCGSYVYRIDTAHTLVGATTASNIRVYPNPANNELNVTGLVQNTSYRLLSVTGITVLQGSLQQGRGSISMQQLAPGTYILELTGLDGERDMVRVVKD